MIPSKEVKIPITEAMIPSKEAVLRIIEAKLPILGVIIGILRVISEKPMFLRFNKAQ